MSIRSLSALAIERDRTSPGDVVKARGTDEVQQFRDVIISAIPSEILAGYTALAGVIAGVVTATGGTYLPLRWAVFGAFAALTPVAVVLSYYFAADRRLRRWPLLETSSATLVALGWFLVMPESPIMAQFGGAAATLAAGCITVAAGLILIMLAPLLRHGSAVRPGV